MTNAEAIKTLHELWHETNDSWYEEVYGKAIKALQAQEWIPCSERLPDSKEYVLVTDYGETNIGRRFCDRWWLDYCGDKMKDVTAWMPMPEPYRTEGDDNHEG